MYDSLICGDKLPEDSMKNLKKAASSDPINDLILKLFNENFQGASESLNSLKRNKKINSLPEFKLIAAYYYIKTCHYSSARELLSELSQPSEKDYKYFTSLLKVTLLLEQEQFEEAQILISTLEKDKAFSFKLIYCYLSLKNTEQALNTIESDKKLFPEFKIYYKFCSMLIKNQFNKLLDLIDSQTPGPELIDDFLVLKAFVLLKLEQYSESCKILIQVLNSNNKFEIAWHLISIAYFKLEIYSDCFWSLSKCLLFRPDNPKYLFNLYRLYEKSQIFHIAKGILDKAKKIDPDLDLTTELYFPVFDFSEFGKRKDCVVHRKTSCEEQIFVKPAVKKLKLPKKRKKMTKEEDVKFDPASTLGSLKMGDIQNVAAGNKRGSVGFVHKNPFDR